MKFLIADVLQTSLFYSCGESETTEEPVVNEIIEGNSTIDSPDEIGAIKTHEYPEVEGFLEGELKLNEEEIILADVEAKVLFKWETLTTDKGSVLKSSSAELLENPNQYDIEMSLFENQSNIGDLENYLMESRIFVTYYQETTLHKVGGTLVITIKSDNTYTAE